MGWFLDSISILLGVQYIDYKIEHACFSFLKFKVPISIKTY